MNEQKRIAPGETPTTLPCTFRDLHDFWWCSLIGEPREEVYRDLFEQLVAQKGRLIANLQAMPSFLLRTWVQSLGLPDNLIPDDYRVEHVIYDWHLWTFTWVDAQGGPPLTLPCDPAQVRRTVERATLDEVEGPYCQRLHRFLGSHYFN